MVLPMNPIFRKNLYGAPRISEVISVLHEKL